ncbi:succinate dehydrogenase, hydrophobic membrane anchor protein [Siccirubricoccus sp. KC 17139]|uniref:Succinate dehydrogenase hydrophobic membrane anchor subunit n=1 Tax=Siccirubricoccus soli TaxID=2899147 RepID=A0ABT1D029_9PROT|nr:succinate dehydrogenase, hydrophobic membrane anchor protein [Siccirubricoccus soli]MCO6415249.1 succinate dehydrogenase, hydrophobic membrane anchor protein [Siccirubricoccus soli]MCP2681380.1 succinate dehydrogenase, hydrophobic membrane anchor protein [Siccirubricoccus soli]
MATETGAHATLRSPLGRVRGLGSAKGGTHHWWMQRVSSMALLPLMLWFTISAALLAGDSYAATLAWIGRPVNAVLLLATIGIAFQHTASGIQVIIEDYANSEWAKMAGILATKAVCWLLALVAALAVLRIAV